MTSPALPDAAAATAERLAREAGFLGRRRRLLRAVAALVVLASLGLGLLLVLRPLAPERFEALLPVVVGGMLFGFLQLAWAQRRHWRCPECDARWKLAEVFASGHWNHCPACGVALRAAPPRAPIELAAPGAPPAPAAGDLLRRYLRRRRRATALALALALAGCAALLWAQGRGWSEAAEQGVVAVFAGLVTAAAVLSARCPRCRLGVVGGGDGHCPRCGLRLRPPGRPGS